MSLLPWDWYRSCNSMEFHTRDDSALTALTVVSNATSTSSWLLLDAAEADFTDRGEQPAANDPDA